MSLYDDVDKVLKQIRPYLTQDKGDYELIEVKEGIVKIRLTGACRFCPYSNITLKNLIEKTLIEEFPGQIAEVKQVNE